MRLWEDMGGNDMLTFLKKHKTECQDKLDAVNSLKYAVPYIEMPLLLTQNFTDVGVLTNVDGVEYTRTATEKQRPHGTGRQEHGFTIDQIVMGNSVVGGDIEVESQLETLRSPKKYTDDKDNVLPGLFKTFSNPAGEMYVCIKKANESFYRLTVSAHTIVAGEVIDYCVKYVEDDSMTMSVFSAHCGTDNIVEAIAPIYTGHRTLAEATRICAEEQAKYDAFDFSNKYEMCVAAPIWEMEPLASAEPKDSINADGEQSRAVIYPDSDVSYQNAAGKYYRTITTVASGIRIAVTDEDEESARRGMTYRDPFKYHYYFFVKYDNSPESPMELPYKKGNVANVYHDADTGKYRGDIITQVKICPECDSTYVEVKYVIGAYLTSGATGYSYSYGGDVYYEKRVLDVPHVDYVALDGVDNVPVYSEYVDFEADAKEFYSPRYNLYRTGNTATILEMSTGDIWNREYDSEYFVPYDAYLTKEEYLTNFSLPSKVDVDVTIDRGGASAFERHYKLAECNTMQDLVNYGNNFFNL
jgi:hypothetical protein